MVQNRVIIISYGKWLNIIFQYLNSNLDVARIVIMDAFFLENKKVTIFKDKHTIATSYAFLEEVLNDVYYDYILVALPVYSEQENIVITDLKKWNIKKVFRVGAIYSSYLIYCASIMKYISKNASKYRVFITGISRMWRATDLESYKLPAVCCAYTSQDLYYDYLWAKKILSFANHNFKYAVIGVTEYSFQYDESIGSPEQFLMLPYYLLFKDVHNYHVTKDVMNNIFNERLLNIQNYISLSDKFDLNKFGDRLVTGNMSVSDFANGRRNVQLLCGKRYPDTIKEYKEIFIKYLKLCKNNNIIPIVVLTPTSRIRKYFFLKT